MKLKKILVNHAINISLKAAKNSVAYPSQKGFCQPKEPASLKKLLEKTGK